MKNYILTIGCLATLTFTIHSCKDNDPSDPIVPSNPVEVITTAKLILVEDSTLNTTTATWKDLDGDGPAQPVITGLNLQAGKTYSGSMLLLDESKTPTDTISNEVEEEADVHQFFYTSLAGLSGNLIVEKTDKDDNNLPVGLLIKVTTNAASSGQLKVVLKHYDGINKSTDETVGETDIEVIFPVSIQ